MGGWGWWLVAVSLVGVEQSERGSGGASSEAPFLVRIQDRATAETVRFALVGAARRLEAERCQGLLREFKDRDGRPLQDALDQAGHTATGYLAHILFYDASSHPSCEKGGALALATPGARVVRVCPEAFRSRYRRDPRYVEAIVIHEALHTLGLGENPPSSFEITKRVLGSCSQ